MLYIYEKFVQVSLLRCGWNELMIAGFSHRSVGVQNGKQAAGN